LDEGICDVCREFATAYCDARRRDGIGAANRVNFGTRSIERPMKLNQIGEALGVIVVHMGEEYCVQLLRPDPKLR
jgi:hypothetical protein